MFKSKYLLPVLLFFVFFTVSTNQTYAYSLIEKNDTNHLITSGLIKDSATDSIIFRFTGNINKLVSKMYADSKFTKEIDSKTDSSNSTFTAAGAKCPGYYKIIGYNGSSMAFSMFFKIDKGDTNAKSCPSLDVDEDGTTGGSGGSGGSGGGSNPPVIIQKVENTTYLSISCDTTPLCACIEKMGESTTKATEALAESMKGANEEVKKSIDKAKDAIVDSVDAVGGTLKKTNDKLDSVNSNLNKVDNSINSFHDEFVTGKDYGIKPIPPTDHLIQKPSQPSSPFTDNNQYFTDKGDASIPDKLPQGPDIKDWDGVKREDDLDKDKELNKDKFNPDDELSKDKFKPDDEMSKDKFKPDDEMSKDKFKPDDEMSKDKFKPDDEMSKDKFKPDDEMSKDKFKPDDEMSKDKFKQDDIYEKNHVYKQTNKF